MWKVCSWAATGIPNPEQSLARFWFDSSTFRQTDNIALRSRDQLFDFPKNWGPSPRRFGRADEDTNLTMAARNALPDLLARIEQLEEQLRTLIHVK